MMINQLLPFVDKDFFLIYCIILGLYILINLIYHFSKISNEKLTFLQPMFFLLDSLLSIPITTLLIKAAINKPDNLTYIFILLNVWALTFFFLRTKLPGKAWELIMVNKHNKGLDTFMVVISLFFAAAFGSISSFQFETNYFEGSLILISILFLFVSTNIIILVILTLLGTYVVHALNNRKPIILTVVIFIGIGLLIQESIKLNQSYTEYKEIHKDGNNQDTKK